MKYNVIKNLDRQFRLQIPNSIITLTEIQANDFVYICKNDEESLKICKCENAEDNFILAKAKLDQKARFVVPKDIRRNTLRFELFVYHKEIILKEAP